MNHKFILIIISIAVIIIESCDSNSIHIGEMNSNYKRLRSSFDSAFVSHFPRSIDKLPAKFQRSKDTRRSHPGLRLKYKKTLDEIKYLKAELDSISLAKYKSEDTCLLIIDSHLNEKNWLKYDKWLRIGPEVTGIDKDCNLGKLPVPKFWEEGWHENTSTQIGLNPGYTLYVLDSKSGVFMDESKLPNGKYTPFVWEHGYTRGVAINEKDNVVIYWFDIW